MRMIVTRKVLISMIFLGLTVLGIVSYRQLKIELFPNAEAPYLVVQVSSQTEVDPTYMEKQAVIPLEGARNQGTYLNRSPEKRYHKCGL